MAQYPRLPRPDGSYYTPDDGGTQFVQADGQSFQPTAPQRQMGEYNALAKPLQFSATSPETRFAATASLNAPPFRPLSGSAPAAATLAAASAAAPAAGLHPFIAGLLGKGSAAATTVGTAIKNNPLGALNTGLGVAGALQYATAKAPPMLGKPDTYAPVIRPAQGLNSSSLEAGRRGIQSAQTQAGRAVGADTGTTGVTRLLAQQQAGEQQSMLSLKDNEAFQTDQRRVDEQTNQAYDANFKTQRSFEEKRYDLQQRQFEARRQQSAAMSQAALGYLTQDRADKLNSIARLKESALYAQAGVARPEMRPRQAGARGVNNSTGSSYESTYDNTDDYVPRSKARGGVLPDAPALHAQGGTLKVKTKASFGGRAGGDGFHAAAGKAFADRMDAITSQAMTAFHTTLREASNRRAQGLSGK